MTGPESLTTYCTVCGGPILQPGCFEDVPDWLSSAAILYHDQQDAQGETIPFGDVVEAQANLDWGVYFNLTSVDPPLYVTACDGDYHDSQCPVYLPLHNACLSIIKEVSASRSQETAQLVLFKAWRALFDRFLASTQGWYEPKSYLQEEHGYYGINSVQDLQYQHRSGDQALDCIRRRAEADPKAIPDLSFAVLENLQVVPLATSTSLRTSDTQTTFAQLPSELSQRILTELQPFSDQPQTCTYQIPPHHWKQMLLDGALVPWLPKLDQDCVELKEAEVEDKNTEWDWERLSRRLSRLSPGDGALQREQRDLKLPMGLMNRRRIWKLAENLLESDS